MPRKLNTEEFKKRATKIHGSGRYDYSQTAYENADKKLKIICPKHGEFFQTPTNHLQGAGCPDCGIEKRIEANRSNIGEFKKRAIQIHGDRYDYSQVVYVNSKTKINIICKKHGKFTQTPDSHLNDRQGCPKCGIEKRAKAKRFTLEDFKKRAVQVHGDRYDYSQVVYVNSQTKIKIICKQHGEFFQIPNAHLHNRQGCPKCAVEKRTKGQTHTRDKFIEKARSIHGNKYKYTSVEYQTSHIPVSITCKKHGPFRQMPYNHLQGKGCPRCKHPLKEQIELAEFIQRIIPNVQIEQNKKYLFESRPQLEVDIYVPEREVGFEWNGFPFHYETHLNPAYPNGFDRKRHSDKALLARTHNIRLIQIFADQWRNPRTRPILESLIRLSLNKPQHIIHARKCTIKTLSNKQVRNFLLNNHLYGPVLATVNLGLFHQDRLVSMMSFLNKSRFSKEQNTWELIRYCPILNTSISGGPQKLFKFFLKNYKPNRIECFQDLSIFNTNKIWENLGFELEKITPPAFWPIDNNSQRHHRSQFTKPKMMKKYNNIDPNLTQIENILNIPEFEFHGVVWDAGHLKYVLNPMAC